MEKTFKVGQKYTARSAGDYDCIFTFEVLKRTEKTVTVIGDLIKEPKRLKIHHFGVQESFMPYGSYSMAPVVSAT